MTGKSGNLSWTRKGYRSSCGINYICEFQFQILKSVGLWNPVVSISGMMRSHGQPPNSWPFRLCKTLSSFDGILRGAWSWQIEWWCSFHIVPHQDRRETTIVQRNEEKQKVQTFLCCGFAGVNILGGCVSKLRAPKTSSICYQNSDNLRCYLRATYASWN